MRITILVIPMLVASVAIAGAQTGSTNAGFVNGQPISEEQVLEKAAPELRLLDAGQPAQNERLDRQRLEAMHRALDAIAEERLLALEAAQLGTTPAQVLEAEVESNVAVPSDEQVAAYYERNKGSISTPRDEALPQLRQRLIDSSRKAYRDALLRRLKRVYGFRSLLEPLRTDVATAGHPSRGAADAPVTIVEFSDFECPFCGGLFPTLKAIEKQYPDTVRIVYRHFPLNHIHPRAQKAAEASLCALEQGRFWEMHDSLFGAQQDLGVDSLKRRASELYLDTGAFNECLDSGSQAERVRRDIEDGTRAGVSGTPTVFINGRIVLGNQPTEMRVIIEDELARAR